LCLNIIEMSEKNFVSLKDETIRIFDNSFLDWCSRIHWTFPLMVWVPVVLFSLWKAIFDFEYSILMTIAMFFVGIFIWTFSEYMMHRFVFHYHPTSQFGKKIHFLMHGIHHDYPNDSKRLVMPPLMSALLSIPFFALFYYGFGGQGATFAAFAGLVTGYLAYDMLHYAVHHAQWKNTYFENLKKQHMAHHYVHPDQVFGVSSTFWDIIFGTTLEKARQQRDAN